MNHAMDGSAIWMGMLPLLHSVNLELSMGNRKCEKNPFQWDHAQLILHSTSEYDPSIPRVRLIRKDGDVVSGCVTFFDDGRFYSIGKERTRSSLRCISSRLQQYDTQDATRKRRPGGKRPGAWAGICVYGSRSATKVFKPSQMGSSTNDP
jgi:hypothetical protein